TDVNWEDKKGLISVKLTSLEVGRGGNSGGPVLTEDGKLVGVVFASNQVFDPKREQGLVYVIRIQAILDKLDAHHPGHKILSEYQSMPFVASAYQPIVLGGGLLCFLGAWLGGIWLGRPLRSVVAPFGLASFALATSAVHARKMLQTWSARTRSVRRLVRLSI